MKTTSTAPFASTAPVVPWWRRALRAFRGRPVQPSVDWCLDGALFSAAAERALRRAYALAQTEDRPVEARDLLRALVDSAELAAILADDAARAAVDAALAAADAGADDNAAHDAVTRMVVAARNRAGRMRVAVGSRALLASLWVIDDPLSRSLDAVKPHLARDLAPPGRAARHDASARSRTAASAPALIAALARTPALAELWRVLDARFERFGADRSQGVREGIREGAGDGVREGGGVVGGDTVFDVEVSQEIADAVAADPHRVLGDVARMPGAPLVAFAAVRPEEALTMLAHGVRAHAAVDDDDAPPGAELAILAHDDDFTLQAFVLEVFTRELGLDENAATIAMHAVHDSELPAADRAAPAGGGGGGGGAVGGGGVVVARLPRAEAIAAVNRVHALGRERLQPLKLSLAST